MKIKNIIGLPFGLAGAGVGLGLAGEAFSSPGLTQAGQTATGFISPAISIGVGGSLIKEVRKLKEVNK